MTETVDRMREFMGYAHSLRGYEKGEAQVFCDRLFQAFGHAGFKEAGAELEYRVPKRRGRGTKFADLIWRPRVLIEMKSRGTRLERHYRQAFEYWIELVPDRPRYVVLCNFDEFWVYDFDAQLDSPVDRLALEELPDRYTALNFLFLDDPKPLFGNDKVKVTREAADKVARVFNELIARGEDRERAQRFILQCVVAMFSEDFDLLPRDLFTMLLADCVERGESAYDLIGGLFRQMADPDAARGGRYTGVQYFNGGLFETVEPVDLSRAECSLLLEAASEHWSSVAPPIFGTLFQSSMDKKRRHATGAHFTSEADIQKVVLPTIVQPWQERIDGADTLRELETLADEILRFRILDPACGSGNFLYVAYRELVNLEMEILQKIHDKFGDRARKAAGSHSLVSTKQFHGIDRDAFAVELAKVTLMLGKRIAVAENRESRFAEQQDLPFEFEKPLPLDNLDDHIVADDALFCAWPTADAIIGNPPYQSKNKIVDELGRAYVDSVRARFPDVPGRSDYCVYWFRRAHDELSPGSRAGLVGTNTIRQNYSREGGLDYITANGGTITQAVSSQVWSGDAAVHVSIVNWVKGRELGKKKIFKQLGDRLDSPWEVTEVDEINPALSPGADVTKAETLAVNAEAAVCFQGQTHGHKGFLLAPAQAEDLCRDPAAMDVVHAYLTGDDLLEAGVPRRFVIDLSACNDLMEARAHRGAFERVHKLVMPDVVKKAEKERKRTKRDTGPRQSHARRWWRLWRGRPELLAVIDELPRYIACARVTKRPVFAFVSSKVRPNDALQVFALADDYSFGILASNAHWEWFTERCSTLKGDFRYTSNTVFDSFPWPQSPGSDAVWEVARAGRALRAMRHRLLTEGELSLRELYRTLEVPGRHPLKEAHSALDEAVRGVYELGRDTPVLEGLLSLNQQVADRELRALPVQGPGLPACVENPAEFVSDDCFAAEFA